MKYKAIIVAGICATVSACVPTTSYYLYNKKANVSRAHKDDYNCELAAARAVPQALRIATTPTYSTPVTTNCYNTGYSVQCNTSGGQVYGGDTYSYDANRQLRNEFYASCMANKGWTVYELENCDPEKVPATLREKLNGRLRPPKEGACYLPLTPRAGNIVYPSELLK